ncbi:hypothetical protein [Xanthomonas nasturtii]|uniref:hypothetical protein n=1 Tax=Xanthomonas nasturtii TaxID=1843581 RepID=UPI002013AEC1|nr:hypothetical protein [Xanthomonas nasturtii]MCL1561626.1 hypothetical protein [Xanthomonas nasturtii]
MNYARFLAVSSVAGSLINGPGSNAEAASDILVDKITGVISSTINRWTGGPESKGVSQLQSGYNPSESVKPYTFVEIDGVSYPVYTYEEAKKLPPGKGAILTTQGGDQRVLQNQNSVSANYDAATPGAMSDVSTGQRLVFALRYDNNVNGSSVGGRGVNVVRFDGFDVDEGYLKPVDGKTNSYSMQDGTKFNRDVRRQQEALGQNGVVGIWEMPTTGKVNSTTRKLLREFPKNNIEVRERK